MGRGDVDDVGSRIGAAADQYVPSRKPSALQCADAAAVLDDMVRVAEQYGVTFADFDAVADFPRLVIQLIQQRDAQV